MAESHCREVSVFLAFECRLTAEELDLLCGVLIVQTGMMCRRALTCKSYLIYHNVKRHVVFNFMKVFSGCLMYV